MTTLTYQPDQGQPEFSEEELNSIQVGEQMEQEQQQLLAGKYESAEELAGALQISLVVKNVMET